MADSIPEFEITDGIGKKTFIFNTGPITGATATGTKSLAYLFHGSGITQKYKLVKIIVDQIAGNNGAMRIELNRITAEAGTPGGTLATIQPKLNGDTSSAVARFNPTNAPTRQPGTLFGVGSDPKMNGQTYPCGGLSGDDLDAIPWTIDPSTAFGYEVTQVVTATISTAPTFNVTFEWTEE